MDLKESDLVSPENLEIGQTYYVTNLGRDSNYQVNIESSRVYRGTVQEYCPNNGRVSKHEHIYPNIGLRGVSDVTQPGSVLRYMYIKGWNIHDEAHHPLFYRCFD